MSVLKLLSNLLTTVHSVPNNKAVRPLRVARVIKFPLDMQSMPLRKQPCPFVLQLSVRTAIEITVLRNVVELGTRRVKAIADDVSAVNDVANPYNLLLGFGIGRETAVAAWCQHSSEIIGGKRL
jgi:hypothetical protein